MGSFLSGFVQLAQFLSLLPYLASVASLFMSTAPPGGPLRKLPCVDALVVVRPSPPAVVFLPVHLKLGGSNRSDVPQTFCSPCLSGYAAAGDNLLFARRLLTPFLFPAFVVLFQEAQESVSPGISGN